MVHLRHLHRTYLQYISISIYIQLAKLWFQKKPLLFEEHVNFDSKFFNWLETTLQLVIFC